MKKNNSLGNNLTEIVPTKHFLLIMRAVFILLFTCVFCSMAEVSYTQDARVTINKRNVTLLEVLTEIERQTDYLFIYNNEVNVNERVSIKAKQQAVSNVLASLLKDKGVGYSMEGSHIILSMIEKADDTGKKTVTAIVQQQKKTITGTVVDATGLPVIGANIVEVGTTNGTITDTDGKFSLDVDNDATIHVSYIGYIEQDIPTSGRTIINITMQEDIQMLDEIVAVGYGTQRKANLVGSVTSVSGEKIASIPASDITNAISGRLPGSVIIQQSGEPGQNAAKILVRGRTTLGGNTQPLVVIDGVPNRSISEIDPVDIESISVLKDASAAIYGTQAANGVILVTTKNGSIGKPRLNYQFYQGFMTPTIVPKMLNSGDYATMLSEFQDYNNLSRTFSDRDIELYYSGEDPWEHPNSDWLGDLIAKWTTSSKHNFTIDGGGENGMVYFVSFGYRNEEAIYKQESTNYKQFNLRGKLTIPINKWLETSVDYAGFLTSSLYPTRSAYDIFGTGTRLVPTQWSFWPTGEPGPDIENGDNPIVTSTFQTGKDDFKNYKNQVTFRGTIKPPKLNGLSLDVMYTYDADNQYRKRFRNPYTLYFPKWETAVRNEKGFITSMELAPTLRGYQLPAPELTEYYDRSIRKFWNTSATYARVFGDHSISIFGAYEEIDQNWNNFAGFRKSYISDLVQTLDAGSNTDKGNWGSMSIYARKSWISRLNYNYKNKYLFEAIFRRDGSLKFPPESRWGNFPGLLVGWIASEEDFWEENISFINHFKVRASYGSMGMDPGSAFQYITKYVLSSGAVMGTGKKVETTVQQSGVANPFITWEKQKTYNIGFDSQILNNMFFLNTEFFYSKRSDILAPRDASVPGFTGISLPDENIAEVDNRGFEIEAGYRKNISNDFRINVTGNLSFNRNKVVFMDEPERAVPWQRRTGHPYGAVLLYSAIGIFADQAAVDAYPHWPGARPGDIIFEDVSGDGKIDSDDRILMDKTDAPEIFYGLSVDASWRNWTLSLLGQGQGDYYRMHIRDDRRGDSGNYFQWHFDNRWTPENRNTNVARAYNRNEQYWSHLINNSTYWYDNMAYFRLKNVVLSYTIPTNIVQKVGLSGVNVFFSGNNLFLLYSAQRNFDPEIGDPMIYPAVKTFAIGANVRF